MLSLRRLAAAAAAAVAVLAAVPAPAGAAAAADVPFTLTIPAISFSTTGSALPVVLSPAGPDLPASLTDVVIDVDTVGLTDLASVSVAGHDCTGTCSLGTLSAATGWRLPDLFVKAKPGADVGASGTVKVTLSADGYEPIFGLAELTVNDVRVFAGPPSATYTVKDGTEQASPVLQFTSEGALELQPMTFRIVGDAGLVFDVPRDGDLLCWRNTSEVRFAERFCDYSNLYLTEGANWQIRLPEMRAPDARPGDVFDFQATYWVGPGARNVVEALKKQSGMKRSGTSTRGLYPPTKLPEGTGGPFGTGSSAPGKIVVGEAPTEQPPTQPPGSDTGTEPPATEPTTPPATTAPTTAPATSSPAPTDNGGVTAPDGDDSGTGGTGGGSGGALPTTGANVMVVAGLGAILLAGGAAAFVIARRRRTQFSA